MLATESVCKAYKSKQKQFSLRYPISSTFSNNTATNSLKHSEKYYAKKRNNFNIFVKLASLMTLAKLEHHFHDNCTLIFH